MILDINFNSGDFYYSGEQSSFLVPLLSAIIPLLSTVIVVVGGWLLNEKSKRENQRFKKRQQRYENLIQTLSGFYEENAPSNAKKIFITQVNLSWLYCSDAFILKANEFLESFTQEKDTGQKEKLFGELLLLARKEFKNNTTLKAANFRFVSAK